MRTVAVLAALAALMTGHAAEARSSVQAPVTQFCGSLYCAVQGPVQAAPRVLRHRTRQAAKAAPRLKHYAPPDPQEAQDVPLPRPRPADLGPVDLAAVATGEAFDDDLARARAYLVLTSTPGFTMSVLGPDYAVSQLHPVFVLRAAAAVREARASGLEGAGLFSSFRPARFGVGGFGDKLNSLHAYGLAGDFTGIGGAGSGDAVLWYRIATKHGLFNPYGPRSRSEFNHYQATRVTIVLRGTALRRTVTPQGAVDLASMWKAGTALLDVVWPARRRATRYAGAQ